MDGCLLKFVFQVLFGYVQVEKFTPSRVAHSFLSASYTLTDMQDVIARENLNQSKFPN